MRIVLCWVDVASSTHAQLQYLLFAACVRWCCCWPPWCFQAASSIYRLCAAFVIGFLVPKWVLRSVAARRRASVSRELPLLIDLVRSASGYGHESGSDAAGDWLDFGNVMPVLSGEILLANQQYSRGSTRERSFGRMSEVYQNLANLTSLMIQIDKYGGAVFRSHYACLVNACASSARPR